MPHFREQPTWKSLFSTTLILYFFSLVLLPARYFSPAVALSHLFPLNPLAPKLQCTFSFYRMYISNTTAIHHRSSPPHSKRFFFSLFRCPYIHQMDSSPFIFFFYLNLFFLFATHSTAQAGHSIFLKAFYLFFNSFFFYLFIYSFWPKKIRRRRIVFSKGEKEWSKLHVLDYSSCGAF